MKPCRVVVPPSTEICGKPARHLITFRDGDTVPACPQCVLYLGQLAGSHGATIKAEKLYE